ncbi:MAG: peptide chain release factor N(5)-glutamine methyltransferase [Bacteroidia bacterium]|nr:peptide chain release factor N(5)-glutamine methyltransferase [Bacteroidia bacterium]NNK71748.1 peptide chain release factor N(5)-glutamine methyltransferase [Flavobacteriaceae bacterium]
MKLKGIQNIFHAELDTIYGKKEVDSFFHILIEYYFDLPKYYLALDPDFTLSKEEQALMIKALHDLKQERPIQYIMGVSDFLGMPIKVNENVLIPRPETEELVGWVFKEIKNLDKQEIRVLDVGTGSGCIAIAIAKEFPGTEVYAIDVNNKILSLARENAQLNEVAVTFVRSDVLNHPSKVRWADISFDIIVSNPPYVRYAEKRYMHNNVLKNEPHLALFVEDSNPLKFYDAISELALENLTDKGQLFFEINAYMAQDMYNLLFNKGFEQIELRQDIFGKDRMIKAIKEK